MVNDTWKAAPPPPATRPEPPEADLIAAYLDGADPDDLRSLLPPGARRAAREHAELAAVRAADETLLRVRAVDGDVAATVVEIVTDDMPFLVDSVTAALARARATAGLLLHPRPKVVRDGAGRLVGLGTAAALLRPPAGGRTGRESWIRVQTRPLGPADCEALRRTLLATLADVRATDDDTAAMRARALELADSLDQAPPAGIDPAEAVEAADLLRWLADEYWTFIGYREYAYDVAPGQGGPAAGSLTAVPGTGLGVLRAAPVRARPLPPAVARRAAEATLLVLTKANRRSSVLRPAHLDYVGIKAFDEEGRVVGERRFLGLFPPEDRGGWVLDVPVVRRRARQVLAAIGAEPDTHDGSGVLQILGSLPRSELLATDTDDLVELARGTLRLLGRRGVRVFVRADPYARFLSFVVALADVEHGGSAVAAVEEALAEATGGVTETASVAVVGSGLVRLHAIVRPAPGSDQPLTSPDLPSLEAALLTRLVDWRADLVSLLAGRYGERGAELAARWVPCFPAAYREDVRPADAVADVFALDELTEPGSADLHAALVPPPADDAASDGLWRFTLYRRGSELSLSAVLPVLSSMGVEVADERPYRLRRLPGTATGLDDLWVFTFRLQLSPAGPVGSPPAGGSVGLPGGVAGAVSGGVPDGVVVGGPTLPWRFAEAFLAAFAGVDDSDGLAGLVISAGLDRAEVAVLRLYLRWLRQTAWSFGDEYSRRALLRNPRIAAGLAHLFTVRFSPDRDTRGVVPGSAGAPREGELVGELLTALDAVSALDEDRILRRILSAIRATVRTNAFARGLQADPPDGNRPLVVVLDPTGVPELPRPLPWREIFVSSAAVEGVHLRFGPIARGGLRWSDRPEDFRTEILGLAKAQTVKNTVIVPTGAKGGFVVRRPPAPTGDPGADREALAAAGRACYEVFIGGLLDVVDTLGPAGDDGTRPVIHPERTVCHDGADSYLVVAADKGTATFSDLANSIAVARGFWLGDAFASGGSAGFDHKKMGITARGAWESVRRHFAELGLDPDTDPVTVVGIGDMSGDVFGNGLLLSRQLRLVAAFDHRHVFLDPDPDPARSFAERQRLFALPRSSWADYDPAVISSGGGVFARTAKSLELSARMRASLGLPDATARLTPDELVHAILLAPVDLLFNGGIGTWVKAAAEPHAAAGDRANDAIRADAADLRVRVVAEGGNLGMTQRGRIEFARAGGRCNTDFVDNSAGVDTSDREVNLKILLGLAESAGVLDPAERNGVLASVVDEVAGGVLSDNRSQNLASATEAAQGIGLLGPHADLARVLESAGLLERALDAFPTDVEFAALGRSGAALSVPELAILSGWAKIWLTHALTASMPAVVDDPALTRIVTDYLPASLRERFGGLATRHPLAAGIAATVVVNGVVDVAGPTFASRLAEELSVGIDQLLLAHTAARAITGTDAVLAELADARGVPMPATVEVRIELRTLTERATRWLIRRRGLPVSIDTLERDYTSGLAAVADLLPGLLTGAAGQAHDERLARLRAAGVPSRVARSAAVARPLFSGLAITDLAARTGRGVAEVTAAHVGVGEVLGLAALVDQVVQLPRVDRWDVRARAALRDDLDRAQAAITEQVLAMSVAPVEPAGAAGLVRDWLARDPGTGAVRDPLALQTLSEAAVGGVDRAELTRLLVAVRAVRALAGL